MSKELESILLERGVTKLDLEKARSYRNKYGGNLEELLVNLGALASDDLPTVYAEFFDVPLVESTENLPGDVVTSSDSENVVFLAKSAWFIIADAEGTKSFVTHSPTDWDVRQYLAMKGLQYPIYICTQGVADELHKLVSDIESGGSEKDIAGESLSELEEDKLRELASEAPTVNLLNSLLTKGLKLGASDMHVEPLGGRCRVRFRIDGVLHDTDSIPKRLELPVISRLKILSGMDIAEKRRPQDGKIETKIANVELDIRVSALPLNDGESIVLRFLRKDSVRYDMDVLGISSDIRALLSEDLQTTAGVILLTGPTGSGKTTSLYTFLNELNNDDVKIITLEDPVEYQLDGINQVQVNSDIGFDFASGLRSIVRQDPDIIMLGEIRDKETASIAMQSALTGHLVFSTVHTNDAPSAFTRLLDLGVEEFLLNAAIVSIVAQRLARKLCTHCQIPHPESEAIIKKYRLDEMTNEPIALKTAHGCDQCGHTGFKGRTAIIEYLRCDEGVKSLPKDHSFIQSAKALNKRAGRRTLFEDGLLKAVKGITTIEEVIRVAG